MSDIYFQLRKAVEARAFHDFKASLRRGTASELDRIVARQKMEFDDYLSGAVDETDFTPYQQMVHDLMSEARQWSDVLEALILDSDGASGEALGRLLGSLLGRVGYLEGRLAALEGAVSR